MKPTEKSPLGDALKAYEDGQLTLWQVAKKAGLSLWEMTDKCKRRRVCVPYSLKDLAEDVSNS